MNSEDLNKTPKKYALLSLGSRDVSLDDTLCSDPKIKFNMRDQCMFINSELKKDPGFIQHVQLPILAPAFDFIHREVEGKLSGIYLILTRNNPNESSFYSKDTELAFDIVCAWLKHHGFDLTKDASDIKPWIFEGELASISRMWKEAEKIKTLIPPEENNELYFFPQGGIDAINTALLQRCMQFYPKLFYLSNPEQPENSAEPKIQIQSFPDEVRKDIQLVGLRNTIIRLLESHDYHLIDLAQVSNPLLKVLIKLASARRRNAHKEIESIFHEFNYQLKQHPTGFIKNNLVQTVKASYSKNDFKFLSFHPLSQSIADHLYFSKEFYLQKRYLEAFSLLYAVAETAFQIPLMEIAKHPIDFNSVPQIGPTRFFLSVKNNEQLQSALNAYMDSLQKDPKYFNPDRRTLYGLVKKYLELNPTFHFSNYENTRLGELNNLLKAGAQLRNNSLHGLVEIQEEDIQRLFPLEKIERVIELLSRILISNKNAESQFDLAHNFFSGLKEEVIESLPNYFSGDSENTSFISPP